MGDIRANNGTSHEVSVILAEDKLPGILIDGISDVEVTEEWCAEE